MLSNVDDSTSPMAPADQCSPSALDDQPGEVPLAAVGDDRRLLVEIELLVLVIDLDAEADLPLGRDAIGADAGAELPLLARLFAFERRAALQAEDPVVPGIRRRRRGASPRLPRRTVTCSSGGTASLRQHAQQPDPHRRRQLPADDVVGIRVGRDGLQRVRDVLELLQAGQLERDIRGRRWPSVPRGSAGARPPRCDRARSRRTRSRCAGNRCSTTRSRGTPSVARVAASARASCASARDGATGSTRPTSRINAARNEYIAVMVPPGIGRRARAGQRR